jgi:hypothetical protein
MYLLYYNHYLLYYAIYIIITVTFYTKFIKNNQKIVRALPHHIASTYYSASIGFVRKDHPPS